MEILLELPIWAQHIMSLYSFSASHPACWHCLGGFDSNAIAHLSSDPHPPWNLITWLRSLHQGPASLCSPHSPFSPPCTLLPSHPTLSWCSCSKQVPPRRQWFLTQTKQSHKTTVLHSLFEFFYILHSLVSPSVRSQASWTENSIGTGPSTIVLTHSQPLPALASVVETACMQYKWISLSLKHFKKVRVVWQKGKNDKEKGEWRQEITEIEQTR